LKKTPVKSTQSSLPDDLPILFFNGQKDWEKWLEKNHQKSDGIWLKLAKKRKGVEALDYPQALESALCYGWIDGLKKTFDETAWIQRFTPRRPRSIWSKINREKAEGLIRDGRMKPAGLSAIESAKRDGRWEAAYDSWSAATVPDDLQAELNRNAKAAAFFELLSSRNRYAILFRIHTAKKAETRAKRIAEFIQMLKNKETVYPQKS
jgi:uncharacterized protein YdeI (YjbR/CyaY-like superfamily)